MSDSSESPLRIPRAPRRVQPIRFAMYFVPTGFQLEDGAPGKEQQQLALVLNSLSASANEYATAKGRKCSLSEEEIQRLGDDAEAALEEMRKDRDKAVEAALERMWKDRNDAVELMRSLFSKGVPVLPVDRAVDVFVAEALGVPGCRVAAIDAAGGVKAVELLARERDVAVLIEEARRRKSTAQDKALKLNDAAKAAEHAAAEVAKQAALADLELKAAKDKADRLRQAEATAQRKAKTARRKYEVAQKEREEADSDFDEAMERGRQVREARRSDVPAAGSSSSGQKRSASSSTSQTRSAHSNTPQARSVPSSGTPAHSSAPQTRSVPSSGTPKTRSAASVSKRQ